MKIAAFNETTETATKNNVSNTKTKIITTTKTTTAASTSTAKMPTTTITTDYLVIGAGAASMAFVDTLLTEQPNVSVVIVDKHLQPGGHWNDAYGFVHLHQPSLLYGVPSKQLEGNWLRLVLQKHQLPWNHRASKDEILTYYNKIMKSWIDSGRVQYYPNCMYDFTYVDEEDNNTRKNVHKFDSILVDGTTHQSYRVHVNVKLVNGIRGECKVPSQCQPMFPIDDKITLKTPNEIYDEHYNDHNNNNNNTSKSNKDNNNKKYVVLGAGKTVSNTTTLRTLYCVFRVILQAQSDSKSLIYIVISSHCYLYVPQGMDTIVFLQQIMNANPSNIYWIMPNDVWMLSREKQANPYSWPTALLQCNLDFNQAALQLEKEGKFLRLDKDIMPTKFRFPVIGYEEYNYLKKILKSNILRRGRVTSIRKEKEGASNDILVDFDGSDDSWKLQQQQEDDDITFVHCTSPGPFNGMDSVDMFESSTVLNLGFLYAPPVPISMSTLAKIESARRNQTLDIQFAKTLLFESGYYNNNKNYDSSMKTIDELTDNDVLRLLFKKGYEVNSQEDTKNGPIEPLKIMAMFLAITDVDVVKTFTWMKTNRLSMLSVPNAKGHAYENMMNFAKRLSLK